MREGWIAVEPLAVGARIPVPAETLHEELLQQMQPHPFSVYWLLEEMRREQRLVCPSELWRQTADCFHRNRLLLLRSPYVREVLELRRQVGKAQGLGDRS